MNLLYSWDATDSTQVNRAVGDSDEGYAEWNPAAGVGLGARTGVYGEWFAFFNTGLSWLLSEDFQWDIRVGSG